MMAEKSNNAGTASSDQPPTSDNSDATWKRVQIERACEKADLQHLVRLAESHGGLLDDNLRQLAWPVLLQCSPTSKEVDVEWKALPAHPEEEQVQKDVNRAFVYYPNNESPKVTDARKRVLFDLIVRVLRTHPMLCYFQGFHDIVQVFLLVLGADSAYPAIESIALFRIRDYMLPTMDPVRKHLALLPCILRAADPELARHLTIPDPLYALPAALTLYAHQIQEYSDIARLFDFILAHDPVMSIYLFAAIIMSRRDELLEFPTEEHEMLFAILQRLPHPLNLEPLIGRALEIFEQFPPQRLPGRAWRSISSSSVLKTMRLGQNMSVKDAEKCFQQQTAEAHWDRRKQQAFQAALRYRGPATKIVATVAVGALALWLRRSGNDRQLLSVVYSLMKMVKR